MLVATKDGGLSSAYDIAVDGQPVARWDGSVWRNGGSFTVQGQRYQVRGNLWGSEFTMTDGSGATVAAAGKVTRREWTVVTGGQTYQFRRPSWWRQRFDLLLGRQPVGFVRRPSSWRSTVQAELPTMPMAAQVFTVAVALTTWDAAAVAAGAAAVT